MRDDGKRLYAEFKLEKRRYFQSEQLPKMSLRERIGAEFNRSKMIPLIFHFTFPKNWNKIQKEIWKKFRKISLLSAKRVRSRLLYAANLKKRMKPPIKQSGKPQEVCTWSYFLSD